MKLSICGDVCPRHTNEVWVQGDIETLFHDVPSKFAESDRVIVNLECATTERGKLIEKIGPNIGVTPNTVKILKEVGVTDCAISNNHIFDLGIEGAEDTMRFISEAGLNYTGFGANAKDAREDLIIEQDGKKIAIIAVCEHEYCYALPNRMGARAFDPYDTIEDIQKAKAENDFVIVLYHGGREQCVYPSPRLRHQSQAMIKQGADVVLCQHSHCIGCYEEYEGGHILYGQGNFHFVAETDNPQWQNGLLVQLVIENDIQIEFIPVQVVGKGIELAKGEDKKRILDMLQKQSDNLRTDAWLEGWRTFCESKKENYYKAICRAHVEDSSPKENEKFAHYLYCEAHRDVWEELCKLSWETRLEP